jgi:serine/threonine protein kinase
VTAPHLGPGHSIAGRYTVRALLGFTGEVATYQAVNREGQEVVVKLYDPAIGQRADVMGQLERVHGLITQMRPELVVPVLDAGYDTGSGAPFTVCDLLHIPSLARLVESGPLSVAVVARILQGIGAVLDAAHAVGLHHHALSPSNVFVGPAPDYAVRITDFSSSVVRSASPTHEAYVQAAPWWAPEQLQPASILGSATDVFTTALIAFFALTGRSYWRSCQTSPPDLGAWQNEIMGPRVGISQRAREFGAVIPSAVDVIFLRAFSLDQSERPNSVAELARVLTISQTIGDAAAAKTLALPETEIVRRPRQATVPMAAAIATPPTVDDDPVPRPPAPFVAPATVTPGLPPFRRPPKKKGMPLLPVIIGVAGALLLGGIGVVVLFMRSNDGSASDPVSVASAAPSTATSADDEDDEPAPNTTGAKSPRSPKSGEGSGDSSVAEVEMTISCRPTCEQLFIDNREIAKPFNAFRVAPGRHVVKAIKDGYLTVVDTVDVKPGKAFVKEYVLVKIDGARPLPKDCGQFLKPCK